MKSTAMLTSVALMLLLVPPAGAQWNPQTVDNSGDIGYYTSTAYDSNGNPHIVYTNSSGSIARHAFWDGLSWHIELIPYSAAYPCIAIDSQDNVHVAYYWGSAYHATRNSVGTWSTEPIGSANVSASSARIPLVLVNDVPHVAYLAASGGELRYAYKSSGSWIVTTVDTGTSKGQYASMAIDASGRVYISYYDGGGGDLRFAYWNLTDPWLTFTVDGTGVDVGQYSSLVLDQSNVPHVCYYDVTNHQLKHATITDLP